MQFNVIILSVIDYKNQFITIHCKHSNKGSVCKISYAIHCKTRIHLLIIKFTKIFLQLVYIINNYLIITQNSKELVEVILAQWY